MKHYIFETLRLGFRKWQPADKKFFAEMNSDKEVMKYFPDVLSRKESDDFLERIEKHFAEKGFGLWAVEIKETREFIGFIGFNTSVIDKEFIIFPEIGWRLHKRYWGQGYATEGARGCLDFGFNKLGFEVIYSLTAIINKPSIKVMKKIGMKLDRTFNHPVVTKDDPLSLHVLYIITKQDYKKFLVG